MIGLGLFQLENLILQRVPFVLVNANLDLEPLKLKLNQKNWQPTEIKFRDLESLCADLQSRYSDKSSPLVVLCEDKTSTEHWAETIRGLGYINVFHIEGGLAELI